MFVQHSTLLNARKLYGNEYLIQLKMNFNDVKKFLLIIHLRITSAE